MTVLMCLLSEVLCVRDSGVAGLGRSYLICGVFGFM